VKSMRQGAALSLVADGALVLAGCGSDNGNGTTMAKCSGSNVNYGGGGSGQGVAQFQQGGIDFVGSDFPLASGDEQSKADARCKRGPAIDIPMVPGPIAVGYNVPGVSTLNLSASTMA
jgi:phosphate transport system substrate-binding protein